MKSRKWGSISGEFFFLDIFADDEDDEQIVGQFYHIIVLSRGQTGHRH